MHKKYLKNRYVEIFKSEKEEFNSAKHTNKGCNTEAKKLDISDIVNEKNGIIRGRGLPFDCSFDDIKNFFKGFKL